MQGREPRKLMIAVFVALALAVTASSAAYACTAFRGKITLTGDQTPTSSSVSIGRDFMAYCSIQGYTYASATNGSVTVDVTPGPNSPTCRSGKLPDGEYVVNYANGAAMTAPGKADGTGGDPTLDTSPARDWVIDCMGDLWPVELGRVTINNGTIVGGAQTYSLPPSAVNGPTDESAVCVSDPSANYGLQGPLSIAL